VTAHACEERHEIASDDATFLPRAITGDQSWTYGYGPETKKASLLPMGKSKLNGKGETGDIKGIVHKEFVVAGQTVNSAYNCDVLRRLHENVQTSPRTWWQKNWLLHHDNAPAYTSFLTSEVFTQSNITIIPHTSYSHELPPCEVSPFPSLKISPFWHNWGDRGIITKHDFRDAFKKAEALGSVHTPRKGTTSSLMLASRPRVRFDQTAEPFTEIMVRSLIF
jgi:hypothetical protein